MKTVPVHEKDFVLNAQIVVFDIFNIERSKIFNLYNLCLKFSFKLREQTVYEDTAFKTNDPNYPLKKFKRKIIKIFQTQRDMSVREIKHLLEISKDDQIKLENILTDEKIKLRNFILAEGHIGTMFLGGSTRKTDGIKYVEFINTYEYYKVIGCFALVCNESDSAIIEKGTNLGFLWS